MSGSTTKLIKKALLASAIAVTSVCSLNSYAGFDVSNGDLVDGNGTPFVMRGINYPHAWFSDKYNESFPAMASTGANVVRVVLSNIVDEISTYYQQYNE